MSDDLSEVSIQNTAEYMQLSMALAMEIASGLAKPSEIFSRYGYTRQEASRMLQHPAFQQMLREAKANWSSDNNAEERIRLKAKLALEELLLPHFNLARSPDTPGAVRNEAMKTFERLSGLAATNARGETGPVGERFVVNINLGDTPDRKVTISAPAIPHEEYADE